MKLMLGRWEWKSPLTKSDTDSERDVVASTLTRRVLIVQEIVVRKTAIAREKDCMGVRRGERSRSALAGRDGSSCADNFTSRAGDGTAIDCK
jgi:hypothetical protein